MSHQRVRRDRVRLCRCGKVYAADRNAAVLVFRRANAWHHFDLPVDFYVCAHRSWHWTRSVTGVEQSWRRRADLPAEVVAWLEGLAA
ncbi:MULTISPECIES: hypothetical protein [Kineococcus]|uniref:hypothetical protein n=1 Tax=Kineococcus TaxID=33981 RepID=UPI0034DB2353